MKQTINIPHHSFSINEMTYQDVRKKTQSYFEWCGNIFHFLNTEENLQAMEKIRDAFDPDKNAFSVTLTWFHPPSKFYTKEGKMSRRCHDLSNVEKPLIDLLFDSKYFEKASPRGVKNLNTDDKYIADLISLKRCAENSGIKIEIEIIPKP